MPASCTRQSVDKDCRMTQAKWSFEVQTVGIDKKWWTGVLFVLGQLQGLAVLSSERHLEVFTNLKCRTKYRLSSIALSDCQLRMGCQISGARRFVFLPNSPVFAMRAIVVCSGTDMASSKWLTEGGISSQPPAPSPFIKQLSRRSRPVLRCDRCQVKHKPFYRLHELPLYNRGRFTLLFDSF